MSSDLEITESKVIAIQGNAVSDETPEDGYVLTWDENEEHWVPRPLLTNSGLTKVSFTSNGSWVCPEGVTNILIFASAGGWGGNGGRVAGFSVEGGKGAGQGFGYVDVTPGETYTITIGVGGSGGIGEYKTQPNNWTSPTGTDATNGQPGGATTLYHGATLLFKSTSAEVPPSITNIYLNGNSGSSSLGPAGLGGFAGTAGNGATGGSGNTSTGGSPATAGNGSNASNNTGAGGGAGGTCNQVGTPYTCTAGNGGAGGSGYLHIFY